MLWVVLQPYFEVDAPRQTRGLYEFFKGLLRLLSDRSVFGDDLLDLFLLLCVGSGESDLLVTEHNLVVVLRVLKLFQGLYEFLVLARKAGSRRVLFGDVRNSLLEELLDLVGAFGLLLKPSAGLDKVDEEDKHSVVVEIAGLPRNRRHLLHLAIAQIVFELANGLDMLFHALPEEIRHFLGLFSDGLELKPYFLANLPSLVRD